MYFLLTRPENDSSKLAKGLMTLGHSVFCEPLLTIDWDGGQNSGQKINLANFQAILFTSANGIRAFVHHGEIPDIPCYVVGKATAEEARSAGFTSVFIAGGDGDKLAQLAIQSLNIKAGPLLHISGQDSAGDLSGKLEATGFQIRQLKLYKAIRACQLSANAREVITSGKITHMPFYSPRTAKTFIDIIRKENLQNHLSKITALCLSPAVFDVISSLIWRRIITAEKPEQSSLFNLIDVILKEDRQ